MRRVLRAVRDLEIYLNSRRRVVKAIERASFSVRRSEGNIKALIGYPTHGQLSASPRSP